MGRIRVALWVKKWNTEVHTATAAPHVCWVCILVPYFSSRASHSCVSLLVKWCCTVRTAVGCSLSPHVHLILFVSHCDVCDRIQLHMWILRYCILVGRVMLFWHVWLLPLSFVLHSEWNRALWADTKGWYRMTRVSVNQGCWTFLWQRSTPLIVGWWFVGDTWKNIKWCASPAVLCPGLETHAINETTHETSHLVHYSCLVVSLVL